MSITDELRKEARGFGHYVYTAEQSKHLTAIADRIDAENDKLRELVHCMAYCMQYERECDECRMNGADGNIAEPCGCDGLLDRLRELGVEVDG